MRVAAVEKKIWSPRMVISKAGIGATVALLFLTINASAQSGVGWNSSRSQATRAELDSILANYDQSARSGGYSDKLKEKARYEASLIRVRLEQGDFQVGDRITIAVDGEPTLGDSLTVGPALVAMLKTGDTISLKGILRSELESKLSDVIRRVVKEPRVHAQSFIRIAVLGAVGKQGFFVVPAEALLSDVLMTAGGPAPNAQLKSIRIERGSDAIWDGEPLQEAITEGRTLDQLSLRAGDRIFVPVQSSSGAGGKMFRVLQGALMVLPVLFGILQIL